MSCSNNSTIMSWLRFVLFISLAWGLLVSVSADESTPQLCISSESGSYTIRYKVNDDIYRVERSKVHTSEDGKMNLMLFGAVSYIDDKNKKHIVEYLRYGDDFQQNEVEQLSPELAERAGGSFGSSSALGGVTGGGNDWY